MFPGSVAVKKTALAALKGKWPLAMAVSTIPLAFYLVILNLFSMLEYVLSIPLIMALIIVLFLFVLIFVGIPLLLGSLRVIWGINNECEMSVVDNFYYFSSWENYKKACTFSVFLLGGIIIKALLLFLPSFIIDLISNSASSIGGPMWIGNLWIFAVVLRALAACCSIYIAFRYYLAPFLFVANEEVDPFLCINKAYTVARVSIGNYFWLNLSLIGWIAISVFFIPMVFTLPYLLMCYVVHSRFSAAFYNEKVKEGI